MVWRVPGSTPWCVCVVPRARACTVRTQQGAVAWSPAQARPTTSILLGFTVLAVQVQTGRTGVRPPVRGRAL